MNCRYFAAFAMVVVPLEAWADNQAGLTLGVKAMRFRQTQSTAKPDVGDSLKTTESGISTFPSVLEITSSARGLTFGVNPGDGGAMLSVGKVLGDLEVGGQLGLTNHSIKDGHSSNTTKVGAYLSWGRSMGNGKLEVMFNPQYVMASTDPKGSTGITKEKTSTVTVVTEAMMYWEIAKPLEFGAGLDLAYSTAEDKEAKVETTALETGITLAKFRYSL